MQIRSLEKMKGQLSTPILLPAVSGIILCIILIFVFAFLGFSNLVLLLIAAIFANLVLITKKSIQLEEKKQLRKNLDHTQVFSENGSKQRENRYQYLVDNINVGVFRTTVGQESRFVEANQACVSILGLRSEDELFSVPSWDLFLDSTERTIFFKKFSEDGSISHYPLRLYHQDGKLATVSISAVLIRDEAGKPIYCDGFIEDVTNTTRFEEDQKKLIDELQAAQLYLNSPIGESSSEKLVSCIFSTTVAEAARSMKDGDCGAVLVRPPDQSEYVGIVTDNDIRKRVVAENLRGDTPVSSVMSAPLIWIQEDALMFEALLMILDKKIDHIVVKDMSRQVTKVIGAKQFLRNQKYPLALLMRDINNSESPKQLFQVRERLPQIVEASYSSSPDPQNMTRIISAIAETVTKKCIAFAIEELGQPPCHYAFITLGSVGREEQTLVTDQDNAMVYDDIMPGSQKDAEEYFAMVSNKVCSWLDKIGYSFCEGNIMAMNPKWCQPVSGWLAYFKQWVSTLEPADLLETKIFFDFRGVDGDMQLVEQLRTKMHELVESKPLFLFHLVHNCLNFKPPLGIFKNIVVEASGQHKEKFNIKKAMTPVVDLARIYALKYGISETGTFARLKKLERLGHISPSEYRELFMVYRYLLDLRFKNQIRDLDNGILPGNHINPKHLSEIEQATLRETLIQISSFQTKMSFDFTGTA